MTREKAHSLKKGDGFTFTRDAQVVARSYGPTVHFVGYRIERGDRALDDNNMPIITVRTALGRNRVVSTGWLE
jgi:hypothetical protein